MTTLNEVVIESVGYPGTYNENLFVWAGGVPGQTLDEALAAKLGGSGSISDRWHTYLNSQGVPAGTLNERMISFFSGSMSTYLLTSGDSWVAFPLGWEDKIGAYIPNLTLYAQAANGSRLYGAGQIMDRLQDNIDTPRGPYTDIAIEGGINDLANDPLGFTLTLLKQSLVTRIDSCFGGGYYDVTLVSMPCMQDVFDTPGNVWYDMVQTNPAIPSYIADFDDWAEAYCAAVGVKFCNINQAPFADGNYYPLPGMSSAAHPTTAGGNAICSILAPLLTAAPIARTPAMDVILSRPNRHLLTAADMTRITDIVTGLGDEFTSDQTVELWDLGQTDVSAGGNALTGLKNNTEFLPRSGLAGTTPVSPTHNATPGSEGVQLTSGRYLRQDSFAPADLGRTFAAGVIYHVNPASSGFSMIGSHQDVNEDAFQLLGIANTDVDGYGLCSVGSVVRVRSSTNPSTLIHKAVELRTTQIDSANQQVVIYESGAIVDNGTTNNISRTYSGALSTNTLVFNGLQTDFGYAAAPTFTVTLGLAYITDGTTDPSLWASVLEGL